MRPGGTCVSARGTHGVHPATLLPGPMAKGDYLVDAAKHIRMALDRELSEDYQAAFNHYKNGVDLLLNGVQVDPNKERREAVKRKTAQYLKTAEDIFNSHLQGSLGNGHPQSGGYSSLRFRPIRNLSSPVEDLKMCKVVGVVDKVLTVQSLVTKETFVVKSLPKSSWGQSREQPTIIPQGVPFMVKLLRYYVSEDAVYLHLEHVPGGRLFSRLHRSRTDRVEGNPESSGPTRHKIRLKTSYTAPAIGLALQQSEARRGAQQGRADSPDADHSAHWDEARRRLESCQTHSYCEETGCLHRARTRPSELDSEQSWAQSSCPASETQGSPAISAQNCTGPVTSVALNGVREFSARDVVRLDTSRDFDCAWNAADPARGRTEWVPLLPEEALGAEGTPHTSQPSPRQAGHGYSGTRRTTSDVVLSARPSLAMVREQTVQPGKDSTDVSATAGNSWKIRALTSIAAPAEAEATSGNSQSPVVLHCREVNTQNGIPAGNSTNPTAFSPRGGRDGPEEGWKLLGLLSRDIPQVTGGQQWDPRPMPTAATEPCEKAEAGGPAVDQPIEVDGWCLLPRVPGRRPVDKTSQSCWGLPEGEVRLWGAQILLALESLHQQGVLCRDLNPKNILLDNSGNVCLTYFGQWSEVQLEISTRATEHMYCAPEIGGAYEITEACDWWSLGALLFELLTGMPLWQCHPAGVLPHTQLLIPDTLSTAAASLLTELLQYDAGYRLGSGGGGVCDIKCHPFFGSVPWHMLGS